MTKTYLQKLQPFVICNHTYGGEKTHHVRFEIPTAATMNTAVGCDVM
jgi:hypothetical protein